MIRVKRVKSWDQVKIVSYRGRPDTSRCSIFKSRCGDDLHSNSSTKKEHICILYLKKQTSMNLCTTYIK
ncbi:unnamed protein product [Gulo gulo]|uniref:Uncharacterized protein n=1 Tax=Gulo gulo TaxID=48420 RepID=A0A9X9M9P5_GULGU|nr:unnamed protein product [Gulo gulo]